MDWIKCEIAQPQVSQLVITRHVQWILASFLGCGIDGVAQATGWFGYAQGNFDADQMQNSRRIAMVSVIDRGSYLSNLHLHYADCSPYTAEEGVILSVFFDDTNGTESPLFTHMGTL